jgi:hypothetical protein
MINSGNQHLGFSPQIPTLTPAEMRNQSTLDRLTTFLRSLVLIPGQGINVRRDGSAGTVVEASMVSGEIQPTTRRISISYDGSNYIVKCPTVPYVSRPTSAIATVAEKVFTFSSLPGKIWVSFRASGSLQWVHDGTGGTDSTTTNQKMSGTNDWGCVFIAYSNSRNEIYDIPIDFSRQFEWNFQTSSGNAIIVSSQYSTGTVNAWTNETTTVKSGTIFVGVVGNAVGALKNNQQNNLYLGIPDNYYTANIATAGTFYWYVWEDSQRVSGYHYWKLGSITLADNLVTDVEGPHMPPFMPRFIESDVSATYSKPVGTGTVTGTKGILVSGT